jgi:hypothetical protein
MGAYGGGDSTLLDVDDSMPQLPKETRLLQNYPNPFNASTTIRYFINSDSEVNIEIYNILGQRLEIIHRGIQKPGGYDHVWDAINYPSGIYFAGISSKNGNEFIKMVFLK